MEEDDIDSEEEISEDDNESETDEVSSRTAGLNNGSPSTPSNGTTCLIHATTTLPSLSSPSLHRLVREVGHEGVWSLSTAKPGNGVEQIRDSCVDTYWQSDGGQPHLINVQFAKRASVCEVAFYLDYNLDESYTPRKISVRAGMTFHDLEEVRAVELSEPNGWVSVPLLAESFETPRDSIDPFAVSEHAEKDLYLAIRRPIRAHFVQICILSMHQNGRDTHIRQVKIFGPRNDVVHRTTNHSGFYTKFNTVEMTQFDTIR